MKSRKRLLSSFLELLESLLADAGMLCNTSTSRDLLTIKSRAKHEGLSFFTITLPMFSKCLERSIEEGRWLPELFTGFKRSRSSCLPSFLKGFTSLVFHQTTGELRYDSSIEAVEGIRQICLTFNKIKMDCTEKRQRSAELAFVRCEADISRFRPRNWKLLGLFRSSSNYFLGHTLALVTDSMSVDGKLECKHGPGTTVDRTSGNGKYNNRQWSLRLQRFVPADKYWFVNYNELEHVSQDGHLQADMEFLTQREEPPSRVCFVPKTMKSPRVIAIEPVYNQYVQQGVMSELVKTIERDKRVGGQINFTDQTINGGLALSSSMNREFATIDLSEASDRVHSSLIFEMLRPYRQLADIVFSSRSKYATLPSGRVIALKKFASQGSALCFPFEAMAFYCIAIASFCEHYALPVYHPRVQHFARNVFVYGDDIIVPTKEVDIVISGIESAFLKVNRGKSFSRSNFRESCGIDAYKGYVVTPVYIRTLFPSKRADASGILSLVSSSNLFYKKGWWKTSAYLRRKIEDITGVVPHVLERSAVVGWYSFLGTYCIERYNSDLHRFEVRGLIPSTKNRVDPLKDYRQLAKFFTERKKEPLDEDAYAKSVRRGSVFTKFRWATPT
jgi:hypothetical protein